MSQTTFQLQDDILQMLYWMRGEHLGDDASSEQLNQFLKVDEPLLAASIERLIERSLLERIGDARLRLTAVGIEEGKRRFLEEFSTYLGKESHIACSDPECDCSSADWVGACRSSTSV